MLSLPGFVELLVCYGLCFGLQHKAPALRSWYEWSDNLLRCSYCTGFHCGWVVWTVTWALGTHPIRGPFFILEVGMWSFASATFCYVLDTVVKLAEERTGG